MKKCLVSYYDSIGEYEKTLHQLKELQAILSIYDKTKKLSLLEIVTSIKKEAITKPKY
jgi:predicted transcriptional regulator